MSPESVAPIFNRGLVNWQVSFVLPKLHSSFHFPCRKLFSVVKPASCTTTSLFIVIFSKNSFFIAFLCLSILEEAFVLKSGCKGTMFSHTSQIYNKKIYEFYMLFRVSLQKMSGSYCLHIIIYKYYDWQFQSLMASLLIWTRTCSTTNPMVL